MTSSTMDSEIQALLNKNTMSDLRRFIRQRQTLNSANWYLKYFFHSVQAAGLLTTSMAQSYGWSNFIWLGIGLNSLATLHRPKRKMRQKHNYDLYIL